ncbi:F-box domain-containing protein [Artemisia annua]|uniref:F-box domain-containing protein n=1 Tax=Artemisia annua TaxID=35608 RepID=A0A2U1Q1X6_ARTAN|nr:F-box domain-containing protein [Artemisia annua]
MAELPSEIILDILSRMPPESLARFRCVSKLWCEHIDRDPYIPIIPAPIIMFHQESVDPYRIRILSLCKKHKEYTDLEVNKDPLLELECPTLSNLYPAVIVQAIKLISRLLSILKGKNAGSCGLGFDASTNTFKMVCVLPKKINKKKLFTMVHVFGTKSWRKISQVPSCPITGRSIFAQGCLYWLVVIEREVHKYKVIWFDVMNEEFGSIDPPKPLIISWGRQDQLVNINGEVGYVSRDWGNEVWVRKREEWFIHCRIDINPLVHLISIRFIGCLNKEGDILMTARRIINQDTIDERIRLFVYKLQSAVWDEAVKIIDQRDNEWDKEFICI